jgi:hypothetical protein
MAPNLNRRSVSTSGQPQKKYEPGTDGAGLPDVIWKLIPVESGLTWWRFQR